MTTYLKEVILVIVGLTIGILLMKSCNKPVVIQPVTNNELQAKVDSLTGIIGIINVERSESIAREMNLTQTILKHERTIKALSTRTFTDLQRDEWIKSYRTKPN
jgi:hypothetical protein